jgi:multicomponent Na+:H+ antiporter subunit E
MFLWNLLLAMVWSALNGEFSTYNLLLGFGLGYVLLWLLSTRQLFGSPRYVRRVNNTLGFILFFLYELIVANIKMALKVLSLKPDATAAMIAVPLDVRSEGEITLLSNLITLTPGTLSVDVSTDRSTLYVHALHVDEQNIDEARAKIKDGFERRVIEVFR